MFLRWWRRNYLTDFRGSRLIDLRPWGYPYGPDDDHGEGTLPEAKAWLSAVSQMPGGTLSRDHLKSQAQVWFRLLKV